MEKRAIRIKAKRNGKMTISIIPGHFATNHSHVNYYIDLTAIKHRCKMAEEAARTLADCYHHTDIDTIICMDGCEVIGGFLASLLSQDGSRSINSQKDICVITPEFNSNSQLIFRDNIQGMVWNKNVLLLIASATTGKTINRSLECIKYYGGKVVGISAIFSAISEMNGIQVDSIFTTDDIPNYHTYDFKDCPECKEQHKIDAIVNSFGYSKI
ncbi:MAG: orotate phosphoribosyltransferase [Candidatus Merdivicinus sp.]